MKNTPKRPARERILDTAAELFYRDGYQATGVDTIVERSGVAKMTLYRHFSSKDELIVAYLEKANDEFWAWWEEAIRPHDGSPRRQIIALFEAVARLTAQGECYGCTFQNTAVEFPSRDHPGHRVAQAHKRAVIGRLREMAARAGATDAGRLADQLFLLMDGAWMARRMFGPQNPARHLTDAARALLEDELPESPGSTV